MVTKPSGSMRITLFAGLALLAACTSRGSPDQAAGLRCSPEQADCTLVSGYSGNSVPEEVSGATIAGGGQRGLPNRVSGDHGAVGGGEGNTAGERSTVAGGSGNTAIHFNAAVGGGADNLADGEETTVGGGLKNTASSRFSTVGGGSANTASDYNATVGGGSGNRAAFQFAAVGGGTLNLADSTAAVVAGGDHNLAHGPNSAILGGINNTAQGDTAAIGGGAGNAAGGAYAAVPGGFANQADGDYSFAAGRTAVVAASHPGTFLFADASLFPFPSLAADEFAVRATGGVRFVTALDASGSPLAGVRLSPGSGTWETLSDASAKSGFAQVDGQQVLEQLMSVPISTWYYRGQGPAVRHIGPTAQDFHAAFGLGQDGRYISTVDEEGVALAAVQALYRLVQQDRSGSAASGTADSRIASLERRLAFSNGLAAAALLLAVLALGWRTGAARRSRPRRGAKSLF
jgi:hypothetical protein